MLYMDKGFGARHRGDMAQSLVSAIVILRQTTAFKQERDSAMTDARRSLRHAARNLGFENQQLILSNEVKFQVEFPPLGYGKSSNRDIC